MMGPFFVSGYLVQSNGIERFDTVGYYIGNMGLEKEKRKGACWDFHPFVAYRRDAR